MGRVAKLSAALSAKIIEFVRAGNSLNVAAGRLGVSASNVYAWRKRGETDQTGIYRQFFEGLTRAEADHEAEIAAIVVDAARMDARIGLRYLATVNPGRWAPRTFNHQEISGAGSDASQEGDAAAQELGEKFLAMVERLRAFAAPAASPELAVDVQAALPPGEPQ